jgi:hypothetical protein
MSPIDQTETCYNLSVYIRTYLGHLMHGLGAPSFKSLRLEHCPKLWEQGSAESEQKILTISFFQNRRNVAKNKIQDRTERSDLNRPEAAMLKVSSCLTIQQG